MEIIGKKIASPLTSLRWRWGFFLASSVIVLALIYQLLVVQWGMEYAAQWGLQAGIVLAFQSVVLWRVLPQNYRQGEGEVLPTFGPGNALTIFRGLLIALIAGFFFLPRPGSWLAWIPAGLYILSDIADFSDGFLARLSNHATRMGESLDMNNDSLGVLVVTLLAFQYGTVPWWYAIFGFARYFFLFGIWLRERRRLPVYELAPSFPRRGFAALQMGFVTAVLFPVVGPPITTVAATIFLVPFTIRFVYDFLQVSGKLTPVSVEQSRVWGRIWRFTSQWLAFAFRLAAVGVLGYWVIHPGNLPQIFQYLEIFFFLMLVLGAAGRTVSIMALIAIAVKLQFAAFTPDYWLALVSLMAVLFLGTGKFSLWRPEDWLIVNRAGEKREVE